MSHFLYKYLIRIKRSVYIPVIIIVRDFIPFKTFLPRIGFKFIVVSVSYLCVLFSLEMLQIENWFHNKHTLYIELKNRRKKNSKLVYIYRRIQVLSKHRQRFLVGHPLLSYGYGVWYKRTALARHLSQWNVYDAF